ncbi:MAG: hypothetical protein ACNI27_05910 [Desulfovibrio sp.]
MNNAQTFRQNCFVGMLVTGGLSGFLELYWTGGNGSLDIFLAIVLTTLAAFAGGFVGYFILNIVKLFRGERTGTGYSDGVIAFACIGSFLGMLVQFIFGDSPSATGATLGAFLGGCIGPLPEEFVPGLFDIITAEKSKQQTAALKTAWPEPAQE